MEMTYNILFVIILFFIFLMNMWKNEKSDKIVFFILFCLLGGISAFRYESSGDFFVNYMHAFNAYYQSWISIFSEPEFLHGIVRKTLVVLFKDPQFYFIFTGFIFVGSFLRMGWKYCYNKWLFVIFFYSTCYFIAHNITCQLFAESILLLSIPFLVKKKNIGFFIIVAMACFIHNASIFVIPLYFLAGIKVSSRVVFFYILAMLLLLILYQPFMEFLQLFFYSDYALDDSYGVTSASKMFLAVLLPLILSIGIFWQNMGKSALLESESNFRFNNFIMHGSFFYAICVILAVSDALIIYRMTAFFAPCAILCIDKALHTLEGEKKLFFTVTVFLFYMAYFLLMNYNGKIGPIPYNFFWNSVRPML